MGTTEILTAAALAAYSLPPSGAVKNRPPKPRKTNAQRKATIKRQKASRRANRGKP